MLRLNQLITIDTNHYTTYRGRVISVGFSSEEIYGIDFHINNELSERPTYLGLISSQIKDPTFTAFIAKTKNNWKFTKEPTFKRYLGSKVLVNLFDNLCWTPGNTEMYGKIRGISTTMSELPLIEVHLNDDSKEKRYFIRIRGKWIRHEYCYVTNEWIKISGNVEGKITDKDLSKVYQIP
jgi:hypothetical protein